MTSNPASGTGIYTYTNAHDSQSSTLPQVSTCSQPNSQHSQSTVDMTTPTLMVNGPQLKSNLQQPPPAPVAQTNPQINYCARPQQFNHSSSPQVNTLLTPPQQFNTHFPQSFNPQVQPPTFHSSHILTAHLQVVPTLLFW